MEHHIYNRYQLPGENHHHGNNNAPEILPLHQRVW